MFANRSAALLLALLPLTLALAACPSSPDKGGGPCVQSADCPQYFECVDQICQQEINCIDAGQCDLSRPYCREDLGKCVATCTPQCTGRCCGSDACGGICPDACAATGQTCDSSSCGCVGQCQPLDCQDRGFQCGVWPGGDGCGGDLQCPACSNGLFCNAQGQCVSECTPLGCGALGYECGVWPGQDGCGGDLQCPACPTGYSCSAQGQCEQGCNPISCASLGYQCGLWPGQDGCGGDLQCPACPSGQACGAGGQCAPICTPQTCEQLGIQCGAHPGADGCGGDLSCGGCDAHSACTADGQCETICDLDALEQDRVIDLNVDSVTIAGTLSLNGAVMPDDPDANDDRGYLIFLDKQTGSSTWLAIGPAGPATFSGALFAGSYDVYFETNSYQDNTSIPNGKTLIARDLDCSIDRQLQWDLPVVTVQANLTVNGGVMPDDPDANDDRGYLIFTEKDASASTWVAVTPSGPASQTARLFAGRYALAWETNSYQDNTAIPNGRHLLESEILLSSSIQRSWDLPVYQLSGQIRLNGQTMPDDPDANDDRGYLIAVDEDTGTSTWIAIGPAGVASYSARLFGGRKALYFETNTYQDNTAIPKGKALLDGQFDLSFDRQRDFDLQVVGLSGQITLNQGVMPDDPDANDDRGYLILRHAATATDTWVAIAPSGQANYTVQLFAGDYAVYFETNSYQDNPAIPNGRTRLAEALSLSSSQSRNWNLGVVDLSGNLTMNGAALPDDPDANDDRGYLIFRDRSTSSSTWVAVAPAGPATWSSRLFAGEYDVSFETNSYQDNTAIPNGLTPIESRLGLTSNQQFSWDLRAISVSGGVTHNQAQMGDDQDANDDRGYVIFTNANTGRSFWAAVDPSGPASYTLRLWAGAYNVQWETNSYAEVDLPQGETRLLRGCLFGGSCEADAGDLTGTWDLVFLNTSWNPDGAMTLVLTQDGQTLTGTYSSEQWYIGAGNISDGSVAGAYISFHVDFAQTGDVHLTGTVANGCFMTGFANVSGGLDSDWLAEKRTP